MTDTSQDPKTEFSAKRKEHAFNLLYSVKQRLDMHAYSSTDKPLSRQWMQELSNSLRYAIEELQR